MADLRALLADLAAGRLTRRAFLQRAAALGVSAPLAGLLATDPALAALAPVEPDPPAAVSDADKTGPAAEKLLYSAFNVDQAPLNIQNGDMDLYIFGLKQAGARSLEQGAQGVRLISAPASTVALILNPAPAPEGQLTPFSIK